MLMRNFFIILINIFFITACGTPSSFSPNTKVSPDDTNNTQAEVEDSLNTQDATKAIDIIKQRLGNSFEKAYISKNQKDAYVVKKKPSEHLYTLVNYDLTQTPPVVKKIIASSYNNPIQQVFPLSDNRLIYLVSRNMDILEIYFYDAILGENIAWLNISNSYYYDAYLDPSEDYLLLGQVYIDIVDIHNPKSWIVLNLDHIKIEKILRDKIGSDFVNAMITKDGTQAFVVENNPNDGINLEHYKIDNEKVTYFNRVSVIEYGEIPKILELQNSKITYLAHNLSAGDESGYWMVIYDYFKNKKLSSMVLTTLYVWNDAYIPCCTDDIIRFSGHNNYIDISRPQAPSEIIEFKR